jgi:hypothetical protein
MLRNTVGNEPWTNLPRRRSARPNRPGQRGSQAKAGRGAAGCCGRWIAGQASCHQAATQRKLDEILRVLPDADNSLLNLEHASDSELRATRRQHRQLRRPRWISPVTAITS